MPWPELMLLRILHQVYHTQIKAVARSQHSTMYTLESSLAASKVEGVHPTQIEQAEPGSQAPGNTEFESQDGQAGFEWLRDSRKEEGRPSP
jgi:hypothetical protein